MNKRLLGGLLGLLLSGCSQGIWPGCGLNSEEDGRRWEIVSWYRQEERAEPEEGETSLYGEESAASRGDGEVSSYEVEEPAAYDREVVREHTDWKTQEEVGNVPEYEDDIPEPKRGGTESQTEAQQVPHVHSWEPVTETVCHEAVTHPVYHEAITHMVHHEEVSHMETWEEEGHYEDVCVSEAWEEPVYIYVDVCNGCGQEVWDSYLDHECESWGSYHAEKRQVDTIFHDAEYETVWIVDREAGEERIVDEEAWDEVVIDEEAWIETVVDQPAWEEVRITGWYCPECGGWQETAP